MWSAGISYDSTGYLAACVDEGGENRVEKHFSGGQADLIAQFLKEAGGSEIIAVIDSTNGLVEGPLRNAGIRVFRADPWHLAARDRSALNLAALGIRQTASLTEIDANSGMLAGRFQDLFATVRDSTDMQKQLTGQGSCLERNTGGFRQVALTFDDGPSELYTARILDILREYAVKATFFSVGLHADAYPKIVEQIKEEGHGIGNHTWSHPFLPDLAREDLAFQIDSTNEVLAAVTGERPVMIRPPYGSRTSDTLQYVAEQGMRTVLWDRDSMDWAQPGAASIIANSVAGITQGSIVLMHDGGGDRSQTVEALPTIIETLIEDYYELVAIDSFR